MADIFTLTQEVDNATEVTADTELHEGQRIIFSNGSRLSLYGMRGTIDRIEGDTFYLSLEGPRRRPEVSATRDEFRLLPERRRGWFRRR